MTLTPEEIEAIEARNAAIEAQNEELLKAYQLTFNSPSGQIVLLDLMTFGKFRVPIDSDVDEGKRQTVLRIMNFSLLSMEQVQNFYRGRIAPTTE